MRKSIILLAPISAVALFALLGACSGDETGSGAGLSGAGASSGIAGGGGTASGSGGGFGFDAGTNDSGLTEDSACVAEGEEATLVMKPVDIIIVIDNSGSMGQEILGVQENINGNFASIIEASGIDYRVIMLSEHGSWNGPESICIEAPLSGIPQGGCASPPSQPVNNPPKFFHYSYPVLSHDSWCQVLDRWAQPDQYHLAPNGYQAWLRPEAFKIFIEITDDGVSCNSSTTSQNFNDGDSIAAGQTAADQFDTALLALSPAHFGTAQERNYRWYSLIALETKDPQNPAEPWLPTDPMTTGECPTAADPGTGYQALSIKTEGLRFPLCEPNFYNVVFNEIALGVIEGASIGCEFEIPDAPPGEEIDPATVVIEFTPGGSTTPIVFEQVANAAACGPNKFYIAGGFIHLCPEACDLVSGDEGGSIMVLYGCKTNRQ